MNSETARRLLEKTALVVDSLGLIVGIKEIKIEEDRHLPISLLVVLEPLAFRHAFAGQQVEVNDSGGYRHFTAKIDEIRFTALERSENYDRQRVTLPSLEAVA